MPEKKKYNYAVMRSASGDYWIGKIKLPANNETIFSTFEAAIQEAIARTDSKENTMDLEDTLEEDCELIKKSMYKWIIKS